MFYLLYYISVLLLGIIYYLYKIRSFCGLFWSCNSDQICENGTCIDIAELDFEERELLKRDIAQKKLGEACEKDSQCDLGLWCNNGVCAKKVGEGESCKLDRQCQVDLYCDIDTTTNNEKTICLPQKKFGYECSREEGRAFLPPTIRSDCLGEMKCLDGSCAYLYY